MISSAEYLGGGKTLTMVGGQTHRVTLEARWFYVFASGAPTGASTIQFPVSDNLLLGTEFTFTITTGSANWVEFKNGAGAVQNVYDKDGTVRTSVSATTGEFGTEPVVRARLISNDTGGLWTIWSVGDAG